ncbi:hypothetical protein IEN85_14420 [Pelagicoccus sp. NFK12]|uniref:Uncharacterized protein n=1 Tax=Pelagicoccus enzymogenes TaxID=2773457 RepID=A0A927IHY2_9BACT|nr:hypothetical protein [Pelagicoccus enzymogenes]MBD5780691.1 hypothetical protein [Pelagicoccus enzymogenes]MDQ8200145.1 hypothetical protein [Pelagicoccus enzymogenes]
MITVFKILGRVGLLLTVLPSILFLFDAIDLDSVKLYMTIGMVAWFVGSILASRILPAVEDDAS